MLFTIAIVVDEITNTGTDVNMNKCLKINNDDSLRSYKALGRVPRQ